MIFNLIQANASGTGKPEQEKEITISQNGTQIVKPDDGKTLSQVKIITEILSDIPLMERPIVGTVVADSNGITIPTGTVSTACYNISCVLIWCTVGTTSTATEYIGGCSYTAEGITSGRIVDGVMITKDTTLYPTFEKSPPNIIVNIKGFNGVNFGYICGYICKG